jgi:uncharacterized protein with FMN-binding domain
MRTHPVRRTVLTCVTTVTIGVLALSLKPHARPAPAAALPAVPAPSPGSSSLASGGGKRTVTGDTVQSPYGPVQVEITLDGSKITAARALQTPNDRQRSSDIAAYSVPVLVRETLTAQSAHIDTVSGATFTSEGYISSLQSALDKAHG